MRTQINHPRHRAFTLIEIVVALTIIAVIAAVAIPTIKGLNEEEKARRPVVAMATLVQEVRQRAIQERRPYQIVFEREAVHACADSFPFNKREEFLKYLDDQRKPLEDQGFPRPAPERDANDPAGLARTAAAASVAGSMNSTGVGGSAGALSAGSLSGTYPRPITPEDPVISPADYSAATARAKLTAAAANAEDDTTTTTATTTAGDSLRGSEGGPWIVTIPFPEKTECDVLLWGDGEWDVIEGDKIRRWVFQPSGVASPVRVRVRTQQAELEASFDAMTGEISSEKSRLLTMWP